MNRGPLMLVGLLAALASSTLGLVVAPQLQIGRQKPELLESTGAYFPLQRPGAAEQGRHVYRKAGCAECHTQQVRPKNLGADEQRGWGVRRTVAADYLYDQPMLLGNSRLGPDLANVGLRLADKDPVKQAANIEQALLHLYAPQAVTPGSIMPPHQYLFEERAVGKTPSANALKLTGAHAPKAGFEIVPKQEALALVAYLLNLRADISIFEAPLPLPPADDTNAVATASTNSPTAAQ